jgi:acid phosphatase (class A)
MKICAALYGAAVLLGPTCLGVHAQAARAEAKIPKTQREPSFFHPDRLPLGSIIPGPPADGSDAAKAELIELHHIQDTRTPEQIKAAQDDDTEEDIFVFRTVLGAGFHAEALPLTAALSQRVHGDEPIASDALKKHFDRPRPYQVDSTIHPVCKVTTQHNSYPSGHTLSGYLLAFTLIEMVPEKSAEILKRADDYAHNRLVCGVHTASDLEASRRIAYAMFGSMLEDARFQRELKAARTETRQALHLGE